MGSFVQIGKNAAMQVRIYRPSKSAMQSGRGKRSEWVLESEDKGHLTPEPLMGWTSVDSTAAQIRLTFSTQEEAERFARAQGWSFIVSPDHRRKPRPRNYGDNFRYVPAGDAK